MFDSFTPHLHSVYIYLPAAGFSQTDITCQRNKTIIYKTSTKKK